MDDKIIIKRNYHVPVLIEKINRFRFENLFTDVTIICQGIDYSLHRIILATSSNYFAKIFKNHPGLNLVIVLNENITQSDFESILQLIYLGEVNIKKNNLSGFIKTANFLEIESLSNIPVPNIGNQKSVVTNSDKENNNTSNNNDSNISFESENTTTSSSITDMDDNNSHTEIDANNSHTEIDTNNSHTEIDTYAISNNSDACNKRQLISPDKFNNQNKRFKANDEPTPEINLTGHSPKSKLSDTIGDIHTNDGLENDYNLVIEDECAEEMEEISIDNHINKKLEQQTVEKRKILVTDYKRFSTKTIKASNLEELLKKASESFGIKKFVKMSFESNGIGVEEGDFSGLPESSLFMLLMKHQVWHKPHNRSKQQKLSSQSISSYHTKLNFYFEKIHDTQKFPWDKPFPLPKFDPAVEKILEARSLLCKTDRSIFNSIINSLYEEAKNYYPPNKMYPTGLEYFSICNSFVQTYDFLIDLEIDYLKIWKIAFQKKIGHMRQSFQKLLKEERNRLDEYEKEIQSEISSEVPSAENIIDALENTFDRRRQKFDGDIQHKLLVFQQMPLYKSIEMVLFEANLILLKQQFSGDSIYDMEDKIHYFLMDYSTSLIVRFKNTRKKKPIAITEDQKLNDNFKKGDPDPELAIMLIFLCLAEDPFKFISNNNEASCDSSFPMIILDSYINPTSFEIKMKGEVLLVASGILETISLWYCILKILDIAPEESACFIELIEFISNIRETLTRTPTSNLLKYLTSKDKVNQKGS